MERNLAIATAAFREEKLPSVRGRKRSAEKSGKAELLFLKPAGPGR